MRRRTGGGVAGGSSARLTSCRSTAASVSETSSPANARPHPDPEGVEPRAVSPGGRTVRLWILVSDDDNQDRILDTAEKLGASVLWRNHYWAEFNGFNGAFLDPWGNTIVLWTKGGDDPQIPEDFTRE